MSAPAVAPRRADLARYGLWQLRDYAINRGAPTLLGFGMLGTIVVLPLLKGLNRQLEAMPARAMARLIAQHGSAEGVRAWMAHDVSKGFLNGFVGVVVFFGAVLAMQGLVSNDRRLGFYRFLFSKPLSPARYYGQAFLLHWAGFMIVVMMLGVLYGAFVEPVLTPTFLTIVAAVFLLYAGLGFLMTALVRFDWLALVVALFVARILWDAFERSESVFARLLYLLPPIHRTGAVYSALFGGTPIPWPTVTWISGYGALAVLAGLLVLRTQRLAVP